MGFDKVSSSTTYNVNIPIEKNADTTQKKRGGGIDVVASVRRMTVLVFDFDLKKMEDKVFLQLYFFCT